MSNFLFVRRFVCRRVVCVWEKCIMRHEAVAIRNGVRVDSEPVACQLMVKTPHVVTARIIDTHEPRNKLKANRDDGEK